MAPTCKGHLVSKQCAVFGHYVMAIKQQSFLAQTDPQVCQYGSGNVLESQHRLLQNELHIQALAGDVQDL